MSLKMAHTGSHGKFLHGENRGVSCVPLAPPPNQAVDIDAIRGFGLIVLSLGRVGFRYPGRKPVGGSMNEIVFAGSAGSAPVSSGGELELSVVIPTFKERSNITMLLNRLNAALLGIRWEAIFVDDDSPDDTASLIKSIAMTDPRIRCLRRVGRRGLAGACIEGALASTAPYVAVMDADLQHDEKILPQMLLELKAGADLAVGSRYLAGAAGAGFASGRGTLSRLATHLAKRLTGVTLADPMSGFFMLRRDSFDGLVQRLSPHGFKILLDIVISARGRLRVKEVPYVFSERVSGESKLDTQVGLDFLGLLAAKMTGGVVTPRFISFALIGSMGVGVHLAALSAGLFSGLQFDAAQAVATLVAMTGNYLLNNRVTYRDRRLRGLRLVRGFVEFAAVSSVGAIANVGIASWVHTYDAVWWVGGLAGAIMGAVWNYSMSNLIVWRVK